MTDQAVPAESNSEKLIEASTVVPKKLQPLRRLLPFILRYPIRLTLTVLFLLVSAVSSLASPAAMGGAIDQGFLEQNLENVGRYGWLIVGIAVIMAAASGARFYFISVLGERVLADLKVKFDAR